MLAALCGLAQQQPAGEQPDLVFRTQTNLAMVKFHVIQKGQYAEDVRAEHIELLEDGKPQKVALFEGPGEGGRRTLPVEIILLFDVSLSVMDDNLLDSYAIRDKVLDGLGGNVGVSVYAFGGKLKKFSPPTNDIEKLKKALDGVYKFTNPGTPLYESIMRVSKEAYDSGGPNVTRAMVIFSDGELTTKEKPEKAAAVANFYGVTLYPVLLGHDRAIKQAMQGNPSPTGGYGNVMGQNPARGGPPFGPGSMNNPQVNQAQSQRMARLRDKEAQMLEFASVAPPTGGRSFDPPSINGVMIKAILSAIVAGVRSEYVAGFYPPSSEGEKQPHKLEVRLLDKSKGKLSGGARTILR